eukprot:360853-Chlamydomonas_euryale.AAC.7
MAASCVAPYTRFKLIRLSDRPTGKVTFPGFAWRLLSVSYCATSCCRGKAGQLLGGAVSTYIRIYRAHAGNCRRGGHCQMAIACSHTLQQT